MGFSLGHLIVILVIVLVIWGPSRLGGVGRGLGDAIRGFKKGMKGDDEIDVTDTIRRDSHEESASHSPGQSANSSGAPGARQSGPSGQQIRDVQEDSLTRKQTQSDKDRNRG